MENSQKDVDPKAEKEEIENQTEEDQEVESIEKELQNPNLTKKQKENLKKKLKKKQKKEKAKEEGKEAETDVKEEQKDNDKPEDSSETSAPSDFKTELDWCIKQIRLGLASNVVSKDQMNESLEVLSVLESEKTPLVKKRHLMKVVFGDYRKLMKTIK